MEVFAGFSENTDWNIGRLVDAVDEMGELDNTLIIYIWGDNGASMEGTITGSFNETTFFNGLVLNAEEQLALIEKFGGLEGLGGEHSAPHFAAAWAHAQNTPFQWGKQMASHLGGDRDPMVVAWPNRIKAGGDLRTQFTHCIDIAPTILDLVGIPEPKVVDGIEQEPMDGTPFSYTLDDPDAAEQHTVQYFEMYGSRAIYKDGWWACARLDKLPWDFSPATLDKFRPGSGYDPDQDKWELYYLPDDFSQAHDLAAEQPEKLAELRELFWQEAERNRALPLLGGMAVFFGVLPPMPTTTRFEFAGDVQNVSTTVIPRIYGRSYAIEADIHVPEGGAEGVLCAFADFIGGFALWVDERGPPGPHVPVPRRGDLQAGLDRADSDRRREGQDAVRDRRAEAGLWRRREPVGQRPADRRGPSRPHLRDALHHLCRHGHGPRQRRRRGRRLRGQGAVRVHRHAEEGHLRPQARVHRDRAGAARARGGPVRGRRRGRIARQESRATSGPRPGGRGPHRFTHRPRGPRIV